MEILKVDPMDFISFILKLNEDVQEALKIPKEDREGLTNLKVQKLIYFIEGIFISKFNKRFFTFDYQAWRYGPVLPEIYESLKGNGGNQIFFQNDQKSKFKEVTKQFNRKELKCVISAFIKMNKFSASELVTLSHIEGPWKETS